MTTDIGYQTDVLVGTNVAAVTASVLLAGATSVTPPALSRDEFEKTGMGGVSFLREFGPSLIDPGELAMELNWLPNAATETLLREMFTERQGRLIQIRFKMVTPNPTCTFRAFLRERSPSVPMEDKMTCSVTFRLETAMTWATAT